MSSTDEIELKPGVIRGVAVALFAIISGALWIGFSVDTYFGSDGPFYFAIILDNASFTNIAPSRAHAEWMTQWPLVFAVYLGVTDLRTLEVIFGLGIWFPWVLGFVISLYATRERPALIVFFLISLASMNLAGWCLLYGEHMVLLSMAWPIFYLAILRRPLNPFEQILAGLLLLIHLKLYETTIASGSVFAVIFTIRVWLGTTAREKWGSSFFVILALASVMIAAYWILFPRDADNRGHFLTAIIGSLAHPYPWMGVSFVVLIATGYLFSSSKAMMAGWITPLMIGVMSLFSSGIWGAVSFSTRTLTLTALPLLMLIAVMASLSGFQFTKKWALTVSALIAGISILHVRHLQSWVEFRSEFKGVLNEEKGFIDPADHNDIDHWGWTNPLLSYVWSEGEVKSVILNRNFESGYEPFDPFTEMVLTEYLTTKPDFLREAPVEE